MDIVAGLLQAVLMVVGFAMWALPIVLALWILQRMSAVSRDVTLLKHQVAALAEHSGAPIVAQPAPPRRARTPLWAFGIVFAVFLVVMGLLYALPGMNTGTVGGSVGDSTVPFSVPQEDELPPPMPEPIPENPGD